MFFIGPHSYWSFTAGDTGAGAPTELRRILTVQLHPRMITTSKG